MGAANKNERNARENGHGAGRMRKKNEENRWGRMSINGEEERERKPA
jgi:hypothetical protein